MMKTLLLSGIMLTMLPVSAGAEESWGKFQLGLSSALLTFMIT